MTLGEADQTPPSNPNDKALPVRLDLDHAIGPHTLPRWTELFPDIDPATVSAVLDNQREVMATARITDYAAALTVHELREVRGKKRAEESLKEITPAAQSPDIVPAPSRRITLFRRVR